MFFQPFVKILGHEGGAVGDTAPLNWPAMGLTWFVTGPLQ